jgi:hypothetical protein
MSYEKAKKYIQEIGIRSSLEFRKWAKSDDRPIDFPSSPDTYYASTQWKNYGDFLGTGRLSYKKVEFINFQEAKKLIQKLGIKTSIEFRVWAKSNERPRNFPSSPNKAYKGSGWLGFRDFLRNIVLEEESCANDSRFILVSQ